jgi:putative SOS response-associated peptidase YedK
MPVILDGGAAEDWLNPERNSLRLKSLGEPGLDDNLVLSPASSLVNSVNNDGPELLVPDRTIPLQRSLF